MIQLEDVKRLHLEPGDVLVLRVDEATSQHAIEQLKTQMRRGFPDHRTTVLVGDMELEVVAGVGGG